MANRLGITLIGTEAERPAASSATINYTYFATDTSKIYVNNGVAWSEISPTSGAAHDHTTADGSGVLTNDEHDGHSEYTEIAAPGTPGAGKVRLYFKTDGKAYIKDDAGLETDLTAGSGAITVQKDDSTIEASATVLDFNGADFAVTSSPAGEANVALQRHGVRATHTGTDTIGSGAGEAIVFDTEDEDTDAYHDNVTNNTRFTVPSGLDGIYFIWADGIWESNSTGRRVIDLRINGTTFIATTQFDPDGSILNPHHQTVTIYPLVAGDYVEAVAFQDSGGDRTITPRFRMYRIGP